MPLIDITQSSDTPTPEESNTTIAPVVQPEIDNPTPPAPKEPPVENLVDTPQFDQSTDLPDPKAGQLYDQSQSEPKDSAFSAGFKRNNPMYNWSTSDTAGQALGGDVDPNYDFLSSIKGTKYMAYGEKFANTVNDQEAQQLKTQIDKEEELSQIAATSWTGIAGAVAGSVADPTLLIPGIAYAKAARAGIDILRTAGQSAALGTAAVGIQETQLQVTQETRTLDESLFNTAAGTVIGGVLGLGAATWAAGRIVAQKKVVEAILKKEEGPSMADIQIHPDELDQLHSAGAAEASSTVPGDIKFRSVFTPDWVAKKFPKTAEQIDKWAINTLALQIGGLKTPAISGMLSDSFVVRDTTRRLFNLPLQLKEQMAGEGYTGKAAVMSMENRTWMDANDGAQVLNSLDDNYRRYLERTGKDPSFLKRNQERSTFNEEAMKAYNRGGKSEIPEASQAATVSREAIQNANKRMVELKIIDEESAKLIDRGDATRVWDTVKVAADRAAVRNAIVEHMNSKQSLGIAEEGLQGKIDDAIDSILHMGDEQVALSDMSRLSSDKGVRFTKARTIDVPNTVVEKWLVNDLSAVTDLYLRQASQLIRFQEALNEMGYESLGALRKGVKDEYSGKKIKVTRKAAEAEVRTKNPGKYDKIDDKNIAEFHDKVMKEIESGRIDTTDSVKVTHANLDTKFKEQEDFLNDLTAIALGQYSMKTSWDAALKTLRTYNATTMLGQVVVSSIGDLVLPMLRHGFNKTVTGWEEKIRTSLMPAIRALSKKDAEELGMAVEYQQNSIINAYFEAGQTDSLARHGVDRFNHIVQTATGKINLISPWTNFGKNLETHIATNDIMSRLENYSAQTNHSKTFLNEHFIDENMAQRILQQQQKWGIKNGPTWILNVDKWTDIQAKDAIRAAVTKNVRATILTPGKGEGSLWLQRSQLGKTIFQFQPFMMSATGNVFLRSLQQKDAHILSGLMAMGSMGILSQLIKDKIAGRESDYSTGDLLKLAVSNSGMGGLLASEAFNLVLRSPVNSKNAHRYQNKGVVEYLGGPSASTLNNVYKLLKSIGTGDFDEGTAKTALKLMPYNNLFYIKGLMRQLDN